MARPGHILVSKVMYLRRGWFIVTVLLVIGAGCSSVPVGDFGPNQDRCEYEAIAEPFDPAKDLSPELNRFQRELVNQAVRQGEATAFYGPMPLKNDAYVAHDGAYYRIQHTKNSTTQLPALVMTVRWEPGHTPSKNDAVVNFTTLPAMDRLALRSAVYGGIYREQVHPESVLEHSKSPVPYPGGIVESDLATRDHLWVSWAGKVYAVTIHGNSTMEKMTHQYNSERVAADAESFRQLIANRYIVRLDNLTAGEREILDAATTGRYQEETQSPSRAWNRLLARLRETDFPESHYVWFVEYGEEWYKLRLHSHEACIN